MPTNYRTVIAADSTGSLEVAEMSPKPQVESVVVTK
jgi:hypothetical protein|tara:strand:+ start:2291 stop:2398 length:108 start_codon:yes stop_codon:yes gene_type:complete